MVPPTGSTGLFERVLARRAYGFTSLDAEFVGTRRLGRATHAQALHAPRLGELLAADKGLDWTRTWCADG